METSSLVTSRNISIVAYITVIGFVIAMLLNGKERTPLANFHIRQALGVHLVAAAGRFLVWITGIKFLGLLLSIAAVLLLILGIFDAVRERSEPLPFVGEYFQKWFRSV
ncbi:MAG: hypothetical protein AAGI23_02250 [Bacteroidota bacterium]